MKIKRHILNFLLKSVIPVLCLSSLLFSANAQKIDGDKKPCSLTKTPYTAELKDGQSVLRWEVSNGDLLTVSDDGLRAEVRWNPGKGEVSFVYESQTGNKTQEKTATLKVDAAAASRAPEADAEYGCGFALLKARFSGPGSAYWQNTPFGEEISDGSPEKRVTENGLYYLRVLGDDGCWGEAAQIEADIPELPEKPGWESKPGCGSVILAGLPVGEGVLYWQDVPGGVSETEKSTTKEIFAAGVYYLNFKASSGCWSGTVEIEVEEVASAAPVSPEPVISLYCGEALLATPAPLADGTRFYWQDSPSGTSTAEYPEGVKISEGQKKYLRSLNPAGCWGPAREVAPEIKAVPEKPGSVSLRDRCGIFYLSLPQEAPEGSAYYWQEKENGESTGLKGREISIDKAGEYWVRALSAEGCWGEASFFEAPESLFDAEGLENKEYYFDAGGSVDRSRPTLYSDLEEGAYLPYGAACCTEGDFRLGARLSWDMGTEPSSLPWKASVSALLVEKTGEGETLLMPVSLEVDPGKDLYLSSALYKESVSFGENRDFYLKVTGLCGEGQAPEDLVLELALFETESGPLDTGSHFGFGKKGTEIGEALFWEPLRGASSYDLEWVFIEEGDGFLKTSNEGPFEHKEAVRVNLTARWYELSLTYPEGRVYYRVRGRGLVYKGGPETVGRWVYGPLTSKTKTGETMEAGLSSLTGSFGGAMNWQSTRVFAEGGKSKQSVSYHDGSLRGRQSLVDLNTDGNVMVAEAFFDAEGVQSLSVLPVPVKTGSLAYIEGFNVFEDGTQSPNNFDLRDTNAKPLSTASGAAKYYSPSNDVGGIHRDYIPDAGGYPYSLTRFVQDGTGRPSASFGPGSVFKEGGGKGTSYHYATPSQDELYRLFGTAAGDASKYKKTVVTDPNGQTSVSYTDFGGRVVATALDGDVPENLIALESEGAETIVFDLDTENGYSKILNAAEGSFHRFDYFLNTKGFQGAEKCRACDYELSLKLTGPDGEDVDIRTLEGGVLEGDSDPGPGYKNVFSALDCGSGDGLFLSFGGSFEKKGVYVLYKELKPIEVDFETFFAYEKWRLLEEAERMKAEALAQADEEGCAYAGGEADFEQALQRIDFCPDFGGLEPVCKEKAEVACYVMRRSREYHFSLSAIGGWAEAETAGLINGGDPMSLLENDPFFFLGENGEIAPLRVLAVQINLGTPEALDVYRDRAVSSLSSLQAKGESWSFAGYISEEGPFKDDFAGLDENGKSALKWELALEAYWSVKEGILIEIENLENCFKGALLPGLPEGGVYTDTDAEEIFGPDDETTAAYKAGLAYSALLARCPALLEADAEASPSYLEDKEGVLEAIKNYYMSTEASENPFGVIVPEEGGGGYLAEATALIVAYGDCSIDSLDGFAGFYKQVEVPAEKKALWINLWQRGTAANSNGNFHSNGVKVSSEKLASPLGDGGFKIEVEYAFKPYDGDYSMTWWMDSRLELVSKRDGGSRKGFSFGVLRHPIRKLFFRVNDWHVFSGTDFPVYNTTEWNNYWGIPWERNWEPLTYTDLPRKVSVEYKPAENSLYFEAFDESGSKAYSEVFLIEDPGMLASIQTLGVDDPDGSSPLKLGGSTSYNGLIREVTIWRGGAGEPSHRWVMETKPTGADGDGDGFEDALIEDSAGGISGEVFFQSSASAEETDENGERIVYPLQVDYPFEDIGGVSDPVYVTVPDDSLLIARMGFLTPEQEEEACKENAKEKALLYAQSRWDSWLQREYTAYKEKKSAACGNGRGEKLSHTTLEGEKHYTLYYYDQAGNLTMTVPPEGAKPLDKAALAAFKEALRSGGKGDPVLNPAHEKRTRYAYNTLGQLTWQATPDAGESLFWQDSKGRTRFSVNAGQAGENRFSYTRYDHRGRVTETGEAEGADRFAASAPEGGYAPLADDLSFPGEENALFHRVFTHYDEAGGGGFAQDNLRGRVSWTEAENEDGNAKSYYSYDPHGNVKSLRTSTPWGGDKDMSYRYDLVSGNVRQALYQAGADDFFAHRYHYDADNRVSSAETSIDGWVWNTEAVYEYYAHGPLARTLTGHWKSQGTDYAYTLQGWLKSVNMPGGEDPGKDGMEGRNASTGKDAFAFALGYHADDWKGIGAVPGGGLWAAGAQGLWNGNIAWMATELPGLGEEKALSGAVYRYDQLNRIKSMLAFGNASGPWAENGLSSSYSYDGDGNLTSLNRTSESGGTDVFSYAYQEGKNRLDRVSDAGENGPGGLKEQNAGNYVYDPIGNLTADKASGITEIKWTPYGKVSSVRKADGSTVSYAYDASGNRVYKKHLWPGGSRATAYARDASGNVMAVYVNGALESQPIYGSSRLGEYRGGVERGRRKAGSRRYELSNHLGNVLAVITDRKLPDGEGGYEAEAVQYKDYYPFGLAIAGRSWSAGGEGYRFGFNGKEDDPDFYGDGTNIQDYGFRLYSQAIAKFLSVDPLTASYPWYTPYQFAGNKPIKFIDLDGKEEFTPSIEEQVAQIIATTAYDIYCSIRYSAPNFIMGYGGYDYRYQDVRVVHKDGSVSFEKKLLPVNRDKTERATDTFFDAVDVVSNFAGGKTVTGGLFVKTGGIKSFVKNLFKWGKKDASVASTGLDEVSRYGNSLDLSNIKLSANRLGLINKTGQIGNDLHYSIKKGKLSLNDGSYNFIITTDGKVKIGEGHEYLSGQNDVLGAGSILLKNGEVIGVSNNSGHYLPDIGEAYQGYKWLEFNGISLKKAKDYSLDDFDEIDKLHKDWTDLLNK